MFNKLRNRNTRDADELDTLMRRISKRAGGGAVTLVDADIAPAFPRSHETPEQHQKMLAEFRETEQLLRSNDQ